MRVGATEERPLLVVGRLPAGEHPQQERATAGRHHDGPSHLDFTDVPAAVFVEEAGVRVRARSTLSGVGRSVTRTRVERFGNVTRFGGLNV